MTKTNINVPRRFSAFMADERGFTLVEILLAVTLMAVVSISFMGYFTAAMDRSMDNTRRITAANLARLKAEEIKAAFRQPLPDGSRYRDKYEQLESEMSENGKYTVNDEKSASGPVNGLFSGLLKPFEPVEDGKPGKDRTVYRFEAEVSSLYTDRPERLRSANAALFTFRPQEKLIRLKVTVYWTPGEDAVPSSPKSFTLDTYLVGR